MNPDDLLARIARTLKKEIGPAIEAQYPKTQAFMASVVVQKLGRQIGLARAHEAADKSDMEALIADLENAVASDALPAPVQGAIADLAQARDKAALCALIDALYASRGELGKPRFEALLGRVRRTLRAGIDRQVEYAA